MPPEATTSPGSTAALRPRVIAARYQLLRELGRGGMGVVWAARDVALGRTVAVKLIHATLAEDETARRRFRREVLALASVASLHVPLVLDTGEDEEGRPFVAMELLNGRDLGRVILEAAPLETTRAVALMLQACDGVARAHDRGIVHRDLKPGNLFVCESLGGLEIVKVLDFGVAAMLDDLTTSSTGEGGVLGTLRYLAPEQAQGARFADERSDLYSLGVVLYQMLTGALPHDGDSAPAILHSLLYEPPVPIYQRTPSLAPELAAIVTRAIARDPDHRYASVLDLADALTAFARGAEIPPVGGRRHEARYRRAGLLAAFGGGAVVAAGFALVLRGGGVAPSAVTEATAAGSSVVVATARDAAPETLGVSSPRPKAEAEATPVAASASATAPNSSAVRRPLRRERTTTSRPPPTAPVPGFEVQNPYR